MNKVKHYHYLFNPFGKYSNRIDTKCCDHKNNTTAQAYQFGYIKYPCFKAVRCLDCNNIQLVCNKTLQKLFAKLYGDISEYNEFMCHYFDIICMGDLNKLPRADKNGNEEANG